MTLLPTLVLTTSVAAAWFTIYRLPLGDRQRANRVALALGTITSLRPALAYAISGTILYIALGMGACILVADAARISFTDLFLTNLSLELLAPTCLGLIGSLSWVAMGVSIVMAIRPTTDLRNSIRKVRWLAVLDAIPLKMRFAAPMLAALVEEIYFRGVVYAAVDAAGGSAWLGFATGALLFTAGQVMFCDNKVAALVIGSASLVVSVFGGILVAAYNNVLPALAVHISFAGYYSNMSFYSGELRGQP